MGVTQNQFGDFDLSGHDVCPFAGNLIGAEEGARGSLNSSLPLDRDPKPQKKLKLFQKETIVASVIFVWSEMS